MQHGKKVQTLLRKRRNEVDESIIRTQSPHGQKRGSQFNSYKSKRMIAGLQGRNGCCVWYQSYDCCFSFKYKYHLSSPCSLQENMNAIWTLTWSVYCQLLLASIGIVAMVDCPCPTFCSGGSILYLSWPPNLIKKARAIDTRGSRVEDKYKYLKEHLRFSLQYGCTWKRVHMVFPIRTTIEDVYGYPHFCTNPCGISWAWRNVGSSQAMIHPLVLPETSVQHGSVRLSQQQLRWAPPRDMECALGVLDIIQSDLTWWTE